MGSLSQDPRSCSPDFDSFSANILEVLPQKRPKDRSRGFVKAYAPVLEQSGIDQVTFLDFLETFEQGIRASPWLEAINLVSIAALSLPIPEALAIDIACMVVIETATSVQTRTRSVILTDASAPRLICTEVMICWRSSMQNSSSLEACSAYS